MVASSVLLRRYLPRSNATQPAHGRQRAAVLIRFWLVVSFSIGESSIATYVLLLCGRKISPAQMLAAQGNAA